MIINLLIIYQTLERKKILKIFYTSKAKFQKIELKKKL